MAPTHRQVVDGAVHRQGANVTTGEKQRVHHIGVGGKRQAISLGRQFLKGKMRAWSSRELGSSPSN